MLVGALLITALVAQQPSSVMNEIRSPDEVYLWGQGTADGKNYAFIVPEATLAETPEWLPEKQDPPLAIPQAIAIANKAALTDHPKFEGLAPASVELRPASSVHSKNRWFYCIGFSPVLEGQIFWGNEITVVLLMDGTVVKPSERTGHP